MSTPATTLHDALMRLPCFSVLPPEQFEELAGQALRRTFSQDETIFIQGEPSAGLWVIEAGNVKVHRLSTDGNEYIMHLLGPGDSFNEIAALDGGVNPANASALTLSTCWMLPAEVIAGALDRSPQMARMAMQMLAGRVRLLVEQIAMLSLYSVTARLARFLLQQAEAPSLSGPGITRAAIALHLGTTPETISRVLNRLQENGAIRFDRHHILVVNPDLLREIALL